MTTDVSPAQLFRRPEVVARLDEADSPAEAIRQVADLLTAVGAADALLVEAATAMTPEVNGAAHPYVLLAGPFPGIRTPAAALAVFRLPVPVPYASGSSLPVRIFVVLGTSGTTAAAFRAVRAVLEDTELLDIITDLPAEEMHPLVCAAVDFYASHSTFAVSHSSARVEAQMGRRVRDIWRLLEAGDNYLKNSSRGDRQRAEARARTRWSQALAEAKAIGHARLQTLAERRLATSSSLEADVEREGFHG